MTQTMNWSALSTPELQSLRTLLQRGILVSPLSRGALQSAGLLKLWDSLAGVSHLPSESICAMIDLILSERMSRTPPRVDLVWTGPEPTQSSARDTSVVVSELFSEAKSEVILAGFSFDHGDQIFAPLYQRMVNLSVKTYLYLDLPRMRTDAILPLQHVNTYMTQFLAKNWPFGEPWPTLYYDPRTIELESQASLHAKCIVVDERKALVTSANFTNRGQTRNLEVGVLIDDRSFATDLAAHWRAISASGLVREWQWDKTVTTEANEKARTP